MPKIRCHYLDCLFLDEKYCSAAAVELNPDSGCQTYSPNEEATIEDWEDEDELDGWDEIETDEDDELWVDEDEEDVDDEDDDY
ncbi:MAG: hypothetical protein MUO40_00400 [Anaerolineaceae bacterium]|nr:hypothetical protein [Anaerolineaceae bacterium]